ncbi:DnaJ C-terminal domain-containing protein [Parvibaculum sp.]|uniref:DnaJ C-terminal domain-containing protein n=1 Tax=Parvibaculum sp. TaxID=2024848 RepID=UPI0025FADD88|nr:DnaJ C-terminal domain-containing protein [Parvibaculum sp.]
MRDPYETLGVEPHVSLAEIKAAYRRLARKLHPDALSGAEAPDRRRAETRFQEVTAAYNLLKDTNARRRYDAIRHAAAKPKFEKAAAYGARFRSKSGPKAEDAPFKPASKKAGNAEKPGFEPSDLKEPLKARPLSEEEQEGVFSEFYEGLRDAGRRVFRGRGRDAAYALEIPFLEAARGGMRRVALGGKTLDIRIPAGLETGRQIRLRGQGEAGSGGAPAGDAFLEVRVQPHPWFRREGYDIHLTLPVTLAEAVIGGKVDVPTLSGAVSLTIPAGSNSGTQLRLRGKGIAPENPKDGPGDQYVTLSITLPEKPDRALRDFAAGWAQGLASSVRQHLFKD